MAYKACPMISTKYDFNQRDPIHSPSTNRSYMNLFYPALFLADFKEIKQEIAVPSLIGWKEGPSMPVRNDNVCGTKPRNTMIIGGIPPMMLTRVQPSLANRAVSFVAYPNFIVSIIDPYISEILQLNGYSLHLERGSLSKSNELRLRSRVQENLISSAVVPFLTFFVRVPRFAPAHGVRNEFRVRIRVSVRNVVNKQSQNGKGLFSYYLKFETPPLKALGAATITGSFTASVVITLAYHYATSVARTGTASASGTPNLFYLSLEVG
ncbi:hypothetical protein NC651_036714 [Populus alba x Populus x berolinensis]|nr:hypothetical protein NC651_036714 [Populus alba x Populus x berolinensis]